MDTPDKVLLTGLLPDEISALLPPGRERYRGMQIFRWIHERGADTFDEMTNLSKAFREEIAGRFAVGAVALREVRVSADGQTGKYSWNLADKQVVESVIIRDEDRVTACISSQAGCRWRCSFCRTGEMGYLRNLTAGEIIDQIIKMKKNLAAAGESITNVVFMGMGEPLDNFDAVARTITILTMETALSIGQRKITVSTCGVVPGILRLADTFKNVGLAISLNATDNDLRNRLMPVNRTYPLETLLPAAREFARKTGRRVTFEYILLRGVNDSPRHARALAKIAHSVPSKVNLIAFNEYPGSPYHHPDDAAVEEFQRIL
jgi:23S rRNA (adenine2503-C2)-methyltransferase